jgi:hypothetical protein
MPRYLAFAFIAPVALVLAGCASLRQPLGDYGLPRNSGTGVIQASYSDSQAQNEGDQQVPAKRVQPTTDVERPQSFSLPELIELSLERNPRLIQVGWAVDAARGRAIQAASDVAGLMLEDRWPSVEMPERKLA